MLVWISSPVRSRKPVLIKTIRSFAARIHSFKFTVSAALLVHDADLECVSFQTQSLFYPCEQFDGRRDFFRPVLFRLHNIDTFLFAVDVFSVALEVMDGRQCCDHCIEESLRDFLTVRGGHSVGVHVNTDVSNQE